MLAAPKIGVGIDRVEGGTMKSAKAMSAKAMSAITLAIFITLAIPGFAAENLSKSSLPHYKVIDLGTPLGGTLAVGVNTNKFGGVGGYGSLPGDTAQHALLWRNHSSASAIDLGTLGGPNSYLTGTYSGYSETSNTDPLGQDFNGFGDFLIALPFVLGYDPSSSNHISLVPLPTLGGNSGDAFWNNDRGEVVGVSATSKQDPGCLVDGQPQAPYYELQQFLPAVWEFGRVKALPLLRGDSDGRAYANNDLGEVVGSSGTCLNADMHGWIWQNGRVRNLGSLGGVLATDPNSINNLGEVTGTSDLAGDATFHAFLWRKGVMTDLGTLPGDSYSYGSSINDRGQIVGESCDINGNCRAFLWQKGVMTDLNTLTPANSNLYLVYAGSIDNCGEIAGFANDQTTGENPAYLAVVNDDDDGDASALEFRPAPQKSLTNASDLLQQAQVKQHHHAGLGIQPLK
jgi:probable HAF family extracellular repeat protein